MSHHDRSYKLLFSHPQMVRDLLVGFVREDWLAQLDFASLEKVNSSYVSDKLRARAGDLVWRARWGRDWVYLYLLMEFQSTPEPRMAVRILTYVGLLYQDLINAGQLKRNEKLPTVLPMVLYNGNQRWRAPATLGELIDSRPRGLCRYRPQVRYLLIDQGRFRRDELTPTRNLAAALFRLGNSHSRTEVESILSSLHERLKNPGQSGLRRAFAAWLNAVILARLPGGRPLNRIVDLQEMRAVISERFYELDSASKAKAEREGRRKGKAELLLGLLRKRFGKLPAWVCSRVQEAQPAQISHWARRLMDVQSLQQLFRGARRAATR